MLNATSDGFHELDQAVEVLTRDWFESLEMQIDQNATPLFAFLHRAQDFPDERQFIGPFRRDAEAVIGQPAARLRDQLQLLACAFGIALPGFIEDEGQIGFPLDDGLACSGVIASEDEIALIALDTDLWQ